MNKRLKGTLLGLLTGLLGIALYVVLYAFVGLIPGIAMFIIAFGFYGVYVKINPTDKSWYSVIIAGVLTVVGAVAGIFIGLAIVAAQYGLDLGAVLQEPEVIKGLTSDLIFTIVFAVVGIVLVAVTKVQTNKKQAQPTVSMGEGAQPEAVKPEAAQPEIAQSGQPEEVVASASDEAAKEKPANQDD